MDKVRYWRELALVGRIVPVPIVIVAVVMRWGGLGDGAEAIGELGQRLLYVGLALLFLGLAIKHKANRVEAEYRLGLLPPPTVDPYAITQAQIDPGATRDRQA